MIPQPRQIDRPKKNITDDTPTNIARHESGTIFTNIDATAKGALTLPPIDRKLFYQFIIMNSQGTRISAAGGAKIRKTSDLSVVDGYIESTTVGSVLELEAVEGAETTADSGTPPTPGTAWAWGYSIDGVLGEGVTYGDNRSSPISVVGDHSFTQVDSGEGHQLCLKDDGTAWAWGGNWEGCLGNLEADQHAFKGPDSPVSGRSSPISVFGDHSFIQTQCGGETSFGLKANGTLWAWGRNAEGALGVGDFSPRSSPVSVTGDHSFVEVSAGTAHTLARKADGSVWAWGKNETGSLGIDNIEWKSSPISVLGDHSFTKIVAADALFLPSDTGSAAMKEDGTIWAWGANGSGQCGFGVDSDNKSSPVSVVGDHSFVEMTRGDNHMVALKEDGTAWSWGDADEGRLGHPDVIFNDKSSPISVAGDHSFIQVKAGWGHTLALKADGTTWGWGRNFSGELGDGLGGNGQDRSSPTQVIGDHSFGEVSVGSQFSLARKGTMGESGGGTTTVNHWVATEALGTWAVETT